VIHDGQLLLDAYCTSPGVATASRHEQARHRAATVHAFWSKPTAPQRLLDRRFEQARSDPAYARTVSRIAATSVTGLSLGRAKRSSHRCRRRRCSKSSRASVSSRARGTPPTPGEAGVFATTLPTPLLMLINATQRLHCCFAEERRQRTPGQFARSARGRTEFSSGSGRRCGFAVRGLMDLRRDGVGRCRQCRSLECRSRDRAALRRTSRSHRGVRMTREGLIGMWRFSSIRQRVNDRFAVRRRLSTRAKGVENRDSWATANRQIR
jgi:hypothetical protein